MSIVTCDVQLDLVAYLFYLYFIYSCVKYILQELHYTLHLTEIMLLHNRNYALNPATTICIHLFFHYALFYIIYLF